MARRAIEEERKRLLCGGSRMCRLFNGGICVSDFVVSVLRLRLMLEEHAEMVMTTGSRETEMVMN